jgi:type I restriction enzyme S subunit
MKLMRLNVESKEFLSSDIEMKIGERGYQDFRFIPPPLAEQHEIVRRVGMLFKRADAIDREVAAAGRRCERLTQAVLGKAFTGRL